MPHKWWLTVHALPRVDDFAMWIASTPRRSAELPVAGLYERNAFILNDAANVDVTSPRLQTTRWVLDFAVDEPPSVLLKPYPQAPRRSMGGEWSGGTGWRIELYAHYRDESACSGPMLTRPT